MTSIIENADTYDIRVSGLFLTACRRDAATLRLELRSPHETWTMIIEGSLSIRSETGSEDVLPAMQIGDLVGEAVRQIRARKVDGTLNIELTNWSVTVEPDDDYEAWQMYSSSGERLIAVPSDGVAVWRSET